MYKEKYKYEALKGNWTSKATKTSSNGFYKRYSVDRGVHSREGSKENRNQLMRSSTTKEIQEQKKSYNYQKPQNKIAVPQNNFYRTFTGKFKLLGTPTNKDPNFRMGIQSRGSLVSGGTLGLSSREDLLSSGPRSKKEKFRESSNELPMESETKDTLSYSSKIKRKGYEKYTISNKLKMNTQEQFFKKKLHNAIQRAEAFIAEDERQEIFKRDDDEEDRKFLELFRTLCSIFE